MRYCLTVAICASAISPLVADDKPASVADVRTAVERSLPFIEKGGDTWIKDRGCLSCHAVTFTIWSHQAAKEKGFAIDQEKLDRWLSFAHGEAPDQKPAVNLTKQNFTDLQKAGFPEAVLTKLKPIEASRFEVERMFSDRLGVLLTAEELKEHKAQLLESASREAPYADSDTYAQLLLGGAIAAGKHPDKEWTRKLAGSMVSKQKPDGLWSAGGQLPGVRRPKTETHEAASMWVLLALAADPDASELSAESRKRALAALKQTKPGVSNESLVLHMLVAHRFGEAADAKGMLKELLAQQRADGGWSWLRDAGPSDGYATGQTLYALRQAGVPANDAAIQRAQKFLVDTQQGNGSWTVESQGPGTIRGWTYWGTTWATIGLLQTLPQAGE